jgi:hypothetical protein
MEKEELATCNISESPLSFTNEFIINSFLHVTILFGFLNILFIYIIAPLVTSAGNTEIGEQIIHGIDSAIPITININNDKKFECPSTYSTVTCTAYKQMINQYIANTSLFKTVGITDIDSLSSTIYTIVSNDNNQNNILNNYILEYSTPNKLIKMHNDMIIDYGISISVIFFIISVILIIVLKLSCNQCINITKIVLENLITFSFIGAVEFWFFMTYASKYLPAPPSTLISTSIDTVKSYLDPVFITPSISYKSAY